MKVKYYESITYVKVTDLLKIVDQLYIDQMEYARIVIRFDDESDYLDGAVHISGVPTYYSSKPTKHYDFIPAADLPHCYG